MNDLTGTLVLGLGNPLMGDDGAGLVALERLRVDPLPDGVTLADGGTWGLNLLPAVEGCRRLLVIDAVRSGRPPGTVVILEREEIPRFLATKLSPHQIDLREVLALAEWRGTLPDETVVVGIEPAVVELRTGLSASVAAGLDALLASVHARLDLWRSAPTPVGMVSGA